MANRWENLLLELTDELHSAFSDVTHMIPQTLPLNAAPSCDARRFLQLLCSNLL